MKTHRSILSLSLATACVLALPRPVLAQADTSATDLDEIIVTATRTNVRLADSLVPAEVIDRDDIERSQARNLPDLLRGRAGISLARQGGAGKLTTVSMRGTEGDHVLVLVDGIRIGSASAGLAMFQDLPIDQIDRVEIIRGPRSSLYGSEAIGGVIQVFTRRDQGALQPRLRIGIGSDALREASVGIGGGIGRGWFGIDAAYQRTDGDNACRGSATLFQGCFADEPDRDGYRNASLSLRGGMTLREGLVFDATALQARSRNEFDGSVFSGNEAENVQQAAGARLAFTPNARLELVARAGRSYDKSDNFFVDATSVDAGRSYVNSFDTRRDTASLQADVTLADGHLLTLGGDWQRDALESDTAFDVTRRDNAAGFAEYQGRFGAQHVQASLRHDDNEQFGGHATGSLGWGLQLARDLRLRASYATGFKAPSFNDLYYPFFGNPTLEPEDSASVNVGIGQYRARWQWTLDAYETHIDELIAYDAAIFLPNNIDQARIRGAEFTITAAIAGWDVSTQLSHSDPRNRTPGPNHDKLLPRRARDSARIDVDRGVGGWRLGATFNASGPRFDTIDNGVRLGGHATLDLRAEYPIDADWTVQARVGNVFDRGYETVAWYTQPGREYGLSLRYAPRR